MERLHLEGSLLGIDLVYKKKLVDRDLSEAGLLKIIKERQSRLILTPIGGQGYLLGRGNQQVSPEVISCVGKENIIIVATKQKIHSFNGRPLLVDTGDMNIDKQLCGYARIITGYREEIVYKIAC
jgi:predicted polyphosphate/ATP-dependent NAD kinase